MKKSNEVMTKDVACCVPTDTVTKAAQLMKSKDVGSVPVVDNNQTKKLLGIVTDRDLTLAIIAEGRDPRTTKVEDVMTRSVITCRAEDSVQEALDAMAEYQLRRIPVVDKDNKLVGIIAQADVATRVNHPEKTAEIVKEISQAGVFVSEP
jgi:CBS domain-containing protein